jgi:hypothetical protein
MVVTGVVFAVLLLGAISITLQALKNQPANAPESQTPGSTTSGRGAVVLSNPFEGVTPISVTHKACGTAVAGIGAICTISEYPAGVSESFNMTGESQVTNQTEITVFADYFAISVNQGDSVDFSMKATNGTTFQGYFDAGANASSAASSMASAAGEMLFNQTGNFQTYSGSARAPESGAYSFAFSVPGPEFNDSVTFLLMDSAAYETGLTVNVGAPEPQDVTIDEDLLGGLAAQSGGTGWEIVPITVYSPETTTVNLTSFTLDRGGWLIIVPAYLPDVGPEGANASIYMVGPEVTTNQFNSSLFIGASGANGLTGDAVIPIEVPSSVNVVSGPGPVNLSAGGGLACPPCMETVGLVYDPANGSSKSPMTVAFSIEGLLDQNGSIAPLPSWLDAGFPAQNIAFGSSTPPRTTTLGPGSTLVTPIGYETDDATYTPQSLNFSLNLQPFEPYYFVMTLDWQSVPKADQGFYTLALDETVDGQHFVSQLQIDAIPFVAQ